MDRLKTLTIAPMLVKLTESAGLALEESIVALEVKLLYPLARL